jgi:DNA helicase-2/ATP-dependent DNA helicase PcrA
VAGTQKLANLDELVNAASLYPLSGKGLSDFLETIELDRSLSADESSAEAVTLITMHNTKGLEFPFVIVTGLEQGLFPRDDEDGEDLEEQRRLFYVAITRAKDRLLLTACRWRRIHGRLIESSPSRFLSEISPGKLDVSGTSGSLGTKAGLGRPTGFVQSGYRQNAAPNAQAGSDHPRRTQAGDPPKSPEQVWHAGMAVYHDEYGPGVILKISPTPSAGPLLVVRFETGKQAQFFPKFTTKLEVVRS